MPLKKISLKVMPEDQGKRLDQFLSERLPSALGEEVSKGKVRKLVVAGAAYLNGHRVRIASKEVRNGARVEVFVDLGKLNATGADRDKAFVMGASHVLYEDEFLIVVNKPAGLPTQPTLDEARDNLFAAVKKFLATRDREAQPYLGLHHRLDRDTSGVILFTKKAEANAGVAELFTKHLAVKTYQALTRLPRTGAEPIPAQWEIKNYLGKDRNSSGKRARFTEVRSGGDFAHTDFRLIEALPGGLWVEAKPRTGRTHQIRVHLSEYGIPILADPVYGVNERGSAPSSPAPRLMLHASNLTFPHPMTKAQVSIDSPLPADFKSCLDALRKSPGEGSPRKA